MQENTRPTFISNVIKYKALLVMLIPGTIVVLLNNYLPMVGIVMAFEDFNFKDGFLGSPFVGLDNFRFLFATTQAGEIILRTISYNVVFIFLGLVASVLTALCLNELRNRHLSKFYQSTFMLPSFFSAVVVAYLVFAFLGYENGLLNKTLLPLLGIEPVNWYAEPSYWPFILVFVNLLLRTGVDSVLYTAAITGIDKEYYEVATIDGASKMQQILNITIPQIKPVIITLTVLNLGNIFRANFGLFYNVTLNSSRIRSATDVIDTYVYRSLIELNDIGMASAASLFQSVVGFITVMLANYIVKRMDNENSVF